MFLTKVNRRVGLWQRNCERWLWLLCNGAAKQSRGVFIFGAQRSGTTMLAGCFENSPAFDVYGETSIAFEKSVLKSLETARDLIAASKRPFVAFKPLTDSHRVRPIISASEGSKAIWMYRRPADRANSAVAKFGETNLRFLSELMKSGPADRWEAKGLTSRTMDALRRLDWDSMDAHSAAGAFWFLRNQLFFDQELESDPDVLLLKYESLVTTPEPTMRALCGFIGCEFQPQMIKGIHAGSVGRDESRLSPEVSALCGDMLQKLDGHFTRQWRAMGASFERPAVA